MRKRFHPLAGVVLDDYWRLLMAMQACLPVLQQGSACLRGWHDVLIYPGEFKLRDGPLSRRDGLIDGAPPPASPQAERSALVLSLADVQLDLEQPWDGCNVVVHEMAHKLDMLDGPVDGVPPLANISRRRWVEQFDQAYARLIDARAGSGSPIDAHAGENRGEYFAVVSELHYSRPALLRQTEPEIAALLQAFYGGSPADAAEPDRFVGSH